MKTKLLLLLCIITVSVFGQNNVYIDYATYTAMKANHTLDGSKNYLFTDAIAPTGPPVKYHGMQNKSQSSICSCLIPLDTTFTLVPMYDYGGANSSVYQSMRNDDASSLPISLPFSFNFYGTSGMQVFINNNGNISFSQPYSQYNAQLFPLYSYAMIAPFWGDVDTRDFSGNPSCLVYYKLNPHSMIVKWENVGYYNMHFDKLNEIQLIMTDGTDPILPAGKNVAFCYGDMQWTTGDASGGSMGFGGLPATVGCNLGDGVSFFQVGIFNAPGTMFDGPYGNADQVDWLDNQGIYFNVAVAGNTPPIIINNNICDTIDVYTGDTTHSMIMDSVSFNLGVTTPQENQIITTTMYSTDTAAFSYDTLANTATYQSFLCKFKVLHLATGLHYIYVTATNNGVPALTTIDTLVIRSNYYPGIATGIKQPTDNSLTFEVAPNPADEYISVKQNFGSALLKITNVIGQDIMTVQVNNEQQTIDISKLSRGIYFATLTNKAGITKTIKVVRK